MIFTYKSIKFHDKRKRWVLKIIQQMGAHPRKEEEFWVLVCSDHVAGIVASIPRSGTISNGETSVKIYWAPIYYIYCLTTAVYRLTAYYIAHWVVVICEYATRQKWPLYIIVSKATLQGARPVKEANHSAAI